MRRSVGLILLAVGTAFFALALSLRFYVMPSLLVTPIDQFAESIAPGTGTVFNPTTLAEENNVDLVAHRTLRGDVAASSNKVGVWDESLILQKADGTLVNGAVDRVAWDRKTGEAVNCCDEAVDGKPTKHKGLSYKFPFHTKKQTYQFFDVTAKKAYPMSYKGSEEILGLTVYRFEQPIAPVQVGTSDVPGDLIGEEGATVQASIFYNNTRTVWVEPLTGVIVKGQEKLHQTFRNSAGEDRVTLIGVTLTFNGATQKQQADLAKDGRSKANLVGLYAPLGLGIVGLIMIGLAAAPLRRGSDPGASGSRRSRREPAAVA
jgi:Porin PorA